MDAMSIRRYLQPSPTLRWHPWAPLAVLLALLLLAFYLGTRWGYDASWRIEKRSSGDMSASEVFYAAERAKVAPALELMRTASKLDGAVGRYLQWESEPPGRLVQWRDTLESMVFFHGMRMPPPNREFTVKLAELRLAQYSAANPRWAATASICEELGRTNRDFIDEYRTTAARYTRLLGRTIRAQDLAPAVLDGRCTF